MPNIHPKNPYQPLLRRALATLAVTVVAGLGVPLYIGLNEPIIIAPLVLSAITLYRLDRLIRDIVQERDAYEAERQNA